MTRATSDAIWDWNLQNGELWWNEGFRTLFGYHAEEIGTDIESGSAVCIQTIPSV